MAGQRVFNVAAEQAAWVVRDNIGLYATRHRTRDEAIMEGNRIAEVSRPCRLVVRQGDGSVAYEMVFDLDGPPVMDLPDEDTR